MWPFTAALLCILTIQRSGASILLHDAGSGYSTALAVLLGEMMKQIICFFVSMYQYRNELNYKLPSEQATTNEKTAHMIREYKEAFWLFIKHVMSKDALRILIPASLYVLQNNLYLYASGRLSPSTFQALWQLRLIPTAFFSQLLLKKHLGYRQWIALCVILVGVISIQQSPSSIPSTEHTAERLARLSAIGAISAAALLASFAGVYLERIFKEERTNLWVANFQLSTFSIIPALFVFLVECVRSNEFYQPFVAFSTSYWPWITVMIHGCAGIMVALTTKYAGCIAGSISGVASIALTHLVDIARNSNATSDKEMRFFAGFALVAFGVGCYVYYGQASQSQQQQQHSREASYSKTETEGQQLQLDSTMTMQMVDTKIDLTDSEQPPVYQTLSNHSSPSTSSTPHM